MEKIKIHVLHISMLLLSYGSSTYASVDLTTTFAQVKDVPCGGDHVILTCSVVGASLQWTVTDTSLDMDTVIFFANPDDVRTVQNLSTSLVTLQSYVTCAIRNTSHPSSSVIESQVQFDMPSNAFVQVNCSDLNGTDVGTNITTSGDPATPTGLNEIRTIVGSEYSSHVIGWNGGDTNLKEYALVRVINESSMVLVERIHPEVNTTTYNKKLNEDVTVAIVAVSRCNVTSNMSKPFPLPPRTVPCTLTCVLCGILVIVAAVCGVFAVITCLCCCCCCYYCYYCYIRRKEARVHFEAHERDELSDSPIHEQCNDGDEQDGHSMQERGTFRESPKNEQRSDGDEQDGHLEQCNDGDEQDGHSEWETFFESPKIEQRSDGDEQYSHPMQATKQADTTGKMQALVTTSKETDLNDDTLEIFDYKASTSSASVEIKSKDPTRVLQAMKKEKLVFFRKRS